MSISAAGRANRDRDGDTQLYVHPGRIAHHCRGYNERSIGIELVNTGRYPDWYDSRHQAMDEPYPQAQIDALVGLLDSLRHSLTSLRFIAGHEDLDTTRVEASDDPRVQVQRKLDPGPRFPWPQVLAECGLQRGPDA